MDSNSTTSVRTLQDLAANVVTCKTQPDISNCNTSICNILLGRSIKNDRLRLFRNLLESWPHHQAHLSLDASSLHYLQSLAILENQRTVSGNLKEVYVHAPYAGYVSTNVLCSAALGILDEYQCLVQQVTDTSEQHRKRQRTASPKPTSAQVSEGKTSETQTRRILKLYTPLNINSTNVKILLRYLRSPRKLIHITPRALIFTSLSSSQIFKVLSLVAPEHLKMLGIDFSLQSDEELCPQSQIPILQSFTQIHSLSLTYNYLRGHEQEQSLINTVKAMPNLMKLNLSGNQLRGKVYLYVPNTIRELILGNVYPSNDCMRLIGEECGLNLVYLKISDNGINNRLPGLKMLLAECVALKHLDLAGNSLSTAEDTRQVLYAVQDLEPVLESLTLSNNMFEEHDRMIILAELSKFPHLRELFLGPYLPDLESSDDIIRKERGILNDLGRPDIATLNFWESSN